MSGVLNYEPLGVSRADDLCALLLNEHVYQFISATPPTQPQYRRRVESIIGGPSERHPGISFDNYVVLLKDTGEVVGTLESTLHDGIAEVAYLFGPQYWGKGYATEGLNWLCAKLNGRSDVNGILATTDPRNQRSIALLYRCGFGLTAPSFTAKVLSYEPGDLVFAHKGAA